MPSRKYNPDVHAARRLRSIATIFTTILHCGAPSRSSARLSGRLSFFNTLKARTLFGGLSAYHSAGRLRIRPRNRGYNVEMTAGASHYVATSKRIRQVLDLKSLRPSFLGLPVTFGSNRSCNFLFVMGLLVAEPRGLDSTVDVQGEMNSHLSLD